MKMNFKINRICEPVPRNYRSTLRSHSNVISWFSLINGIFVGAWSRSWSNGHVCCHFLR